MCSMKIPIHHRQLNYAVFVNSVGKHQFVYQALSMQTESLRGRSENWISQLDHAILLHRHGLLLIQELNMAYLCYV